MSHESQASDPENAGSAMNPINQTNTIDTTDTLDISEFQPTLVALPQALPVAQETASTLPPLSARAQRRYALAYAGYTLASSSRFTAAIWAIYLVAHGYNPLAVGLFEMCFHLAKFVAEVPTGIFADLVGRRASLIVSCALGIVAELFFLAPAPPLIALSLALSGLAFAFRGGADAALLWHLSERSGASDVAARYSRLFSRMFLVMILAETAATASGGALSSIAGSLPFIAQALASGAAILPLLLLPEVRAASVHQRRPLAHFGAGVRAAQRDPLLLGLLLISGLTAAVFTTTSIYAQLFFSSMGFSVALVGLIIAVAVVPDSIWVALAPRVIARLSPRKLLALFIVMEGVGILLMSVGVPALGIVGFLLFFHGADSVLTPAISRYLNVRAPETQRATVLSLDTGLFSATMIVLFPLFGLGLTHVPFSAAYFWTAVALFAGSALIATVIRLLMTRRKS